MSVNARRPARLAAAGPLLSLEAVARVLALCPAPAVMVTPAERVVAASEGARSRLGLAPERTPRRARDILGIGWRELELVAAEGVSDLVVDLPMRPPNAPRQGWRVRPERVLDTSGATVAVVAYLEEPAALVVLPAGRNGASFRPVGFEGLFGEDPRVEATKAAAARFAGTDLPILLLAETGTGKDLLARAVHFGSARKGRPFVAINCGALSPHLLESELFGYAPGAFTDARREGNEGKIGAARGGTLFLDEVAEMPGPLQALLLRVLEDGTYYRVGENVSRQADVRLIGATCRDLPRMVEEGSFRQDLFYRIAGVCLGLPPVRERSDVRNLVLHLLDDVRGRSGGGSSRGISPRALDWLVAQSWPGNVRQIKTTLQYALSLADGAEIELEHLPPILRVRSPDPSRLESPAPQRSPIGAALPAELAPVGAFGAPAAGETTLGDFERQLVRRTVDEAGGNIALAARRLGISRSTLYRHLRRDGEGAR